MLTDTVASIDYLSITFWENQALDVLGLVMDTLSLKEFKKRGSASGRGYKSILFGDMESKLYQYPLDGSHGQHFHLEMSGQTMSIVKPDSLKKLFTQLSQYNIRYNVTRLDVALDTQRFTTNDIASACQNEEIKTRVHRDNIIRYHSLLGNKDTIYFGSEDSETRLRIYKKQVHAVLHNGVIENHAVFGSDYFTRVELQLRQDRANHLWKQLMNGQLSQWGLMMGSAINAFVTILKNWWAEWLGSIPDGMLLAIKHPAKALQKTTEWLHKQVAPSLMMYLKAITGGRRAWMYQLFLSLAQSGNDRLSPAHIAVIDNHRMTDDISQTFAFLQHNNQDGDLLRDHYIQSIRSYPKWYRDFIEANPQYEESRPSDFVDMSRHGLGWVLNASHYHQRLALMPDTDVSSLPAHIQYSYLNI